MSHLGRKLWTPGFVARSDRARRPRRPSGLAVIASAVLVVLTACGSSGSGGLGDQAAETGPGAGQDQAGEPGQQLGQGIVMCTSNDSSVTLTSHDLKSGAETGSITLSLDVDESGLTPAVDPSLCNDSSSSWQGTPSTRSRMLRASFAPDWSAVAARGDTAMGVITLPTLEPRVLSGQQEPEDEDEFVVERDSGMVLGAPTLDQVTGELLWAVVDPSGPGRVMTADPSDAASGPTVRWDEGKVSAGIRFYGYGDQLATSPLRLSPSGERSICCDIFYDDDEYFVDQEVAYTDSGTAVCRRQDLVGDWAETTTFGDSGAPAVGDPLSDCTWLGEEGDSEEALQYGLEVIGWLDEDTVVDSELRAYRLSGDGTQVTTALDRHLTPESDRFVEGLSVSPDGAWILFSADDSLWVVDAAGGDPSRLGDAPRAQFVGWNLA